MQLVNKHTRLPVLLALAAALPALFLTACQQGGGDPGTAGGGEATTAADAPSDDELRARADQLAHELLIVDTHVDVPYRLEEKVEDISERTEGGDFDYVRAREGGLNAPFMSIYVPASYQESGGAKEYADKLIDLVESFATRWPDKFALARTPADLEQQQAAGLISLPMGMENGAPIEDDLGNVQHFFDRGIRYVTLTHSQNNQICDSSYAPAEERKWHGLSPFGREVVAEMNRLGVMVDVSHVSDETFFQVLELSAAPVIASHSSARHFTPGWERNMSDEMIQRLGEKGGVIQINFGSSFLTEAANKYSNAMYQAAGDYAKANDLTQDSDELKAFMEQYGKDNPFPYADLDDVVAHVDHVVKLVGIDHVGLGSDFDGVGDSLPTGLKDVSDYPNLIFALLKKGYSEDDVRKICGANLLRVWREVERVAADLQSQI